MRIDLERTPDGRRFVVSRSIDAPAERVWDIFTDTRQWPRWGPSITDVEHDGPYIAVSSTGRVRTLGGVWLPFTIETVEDFRWTWRIGAIKATGHRVVPRGATAIAAFEVPVLAAPYSIICAIALRRIERIATEVVE